MVALQGHEGWSRERTDYERGRLEGPTSILVSRSRGHLVSLHEPLGFTHTWAH